MDIGGKKVLVTGADGFIGSHLVEELVTRGAEVRAVAYYNSFNSAGWLDTLHAACREQIEIVFGDVRDFHFVNTVMQKVDVVFHLAALIGIPFSYVAPDLYVETNVKGTLNVLQAARAHSLKRVLVTSTSEVYGTAQSVPISEVHPLNAQSPYAASKIGADQLALSFHRSFETPVTLMRPFNTFGPRQSMRAVIPTIISQLSAGGDVVKLGASRPTRDFSYVLDTAQGMIALAECDRAIGEVVNLGSGFEISIADTVQTIADIMGRQCVVECDRERLRPERSEVERLWADVSKAAALAGWHPKFAGLDGFKRGLEQTVAWFLEPKNRSHYRNSGYVV